MFLFLTLTAVVGLVVCREGRQACTFLIAIYAGAGLLLAAAGLEIAAGSLDALKSDELFYVDIATGSNFEQILLRERALWHVVNYWVLNIDIGFDGLALKLINIPLFALLIYAIYRIFERRQFIWLLPLFLPYTLWVSTFNLRDVPIWLSTTLTIFLYSRSGPEQYFAVLPLILLFLLRPFAAFIVVVVIVGMESLRFVHDVWRRSVSKRMLIGMSLGAVLTGVVVVALWASISRTAVSYYQWLIFTTGEGRVEHLGRIALAYKSDNLFRDWLIALVRYATTPLPTSMFERALEGGSDLWGLTDDIVRVIHQTVYYAMAMYLVANWKLAFRTFMEMAREQKMLLFVFLAYWPIYSFHLYGVTHQRSKIPLQIVVFLLFILVWNRRKGIIENSRATPAPDGLRVANQQ